MLRTRALTTAAAAVAASAAALVAIPANASAAVLPAHQALSADGFVDSIGVATHLTYTNTPYGNYDMVEKRLADLGVRHIRDGWGTGSAYASDFVRNRLQKYGIGVTMVMDPRQNATPAALKDMVKNQLVPGADAVESLNEWDTQGGDWAAYARNWTIQVSRAVKGDPATRSIPVLAPSFADTNDTSKYQALGDLSAYVDAGTSHDYPGNQYEMTDQIIGTVKRNWSIVAPGKPVVATETGFSTGTQQAPYATMPEAQVATTLPRLFLEHYAGGISRTFTYELLDQFRDPLFESNFGLLRYDGTPKPSYTALQSMIGLLTDKGPAFTPGALDYSIDGGDSSTRSLLLEKRDGTFYLAVWQQQPQFNGSSVLNPPSTSVTVRLDGPADVAVYRPNSGTAPLSSASSTQSVTLDSSTSTAIIKIDPSSAPTASAPAAPPVAPAPPVAAPPVVAPAPPVASAPAPSTPTAAPTAPTTAPPASAPPVSGSTTTTEVSRTAWTQVANGWGPVEKDRSNGEAAAGDGRTLTIAGKTFSKGLGVHAPSEVVVPVGGAATFSAKVGVDAESGTKGSVDFQVWNGSTKIADSGVLRGGAAAKTLTADVRGLKQVRLVVTDAGDGRNNDHADWASPVLSTPAPTTATVAVSSLGWTTVQNGWGPVEKDRSNGEGALGDGRTLTIGGTTYATGLGVHAGSEIVVPTTGGHTFSAKVGVDDEVGANGSVDFQVWNGSTKIADSGVVTGSSTPRTITANVTGLRSVRLVVTDAGDGTAFDHADWADAKLTVDTTAVAVALADKRSVAPKATAKAGAKAKTKAAAVRVTRTVHGA
ncbi:NPCBM/NEW2 domain-containing protein [Motilibacter rhizosphaerae]|uniref:NPCBM/NEW2 domain-containing protein n=1 Tax=Motilibacter rhizosphaerae TaxID=598652 RepID=A0A4Q7NQ21_9ACTN|nr:NPCBM/NEW2 domain-containing protein [Motilibacter rhizosphaerae]RZS87401.1 NPCBM/NEW2 domain-containing protein [Motilibacter rhizosphaerae]